MQTVKSPISGQPFGPQTSVRLGEFLMSYCVVPENIHTPPTESHWKFLGGGGLKGQTFRRKV